MNRNLFHRAILAATVATFTFAAAQNLRAQPWVSYDDNTRYMALGDSLSAGYAAKPVTQGFVYQLYQGGAIDNLSNLLFCTQAVPGAKSADVKNFQIPQVPLFFSETGKSYRKVVTLTVGGNDLMSLLGPTGEIDKTAVPNVISAYAVNLAAILTDLTTKFPDVKIYVGNLYDSRLPVEGADQLIVYLNQVTAGVVGSLQNNNVVLVDLWSAFDGKSGLLIVEKRGAGFNIHPTNAGYQVMTKAFSDAIRGR